MTRISSSPAGVTILGATGSVGVQTLDVIGRHPDSYAVDALVANRKAKELARLAIEHKARLAVVADESAYGELREALSGSGIEAAAGPQAVIEAAQRPAPIVMAAIVGAAGLDATMAAARRGARVAFANKECLVCAGPLLLDAMRQGGGDLLPVDSEHSAIFQCLNTDQRDQILRLILTCSGGPFRGWSRDRLEHVTPAQALKHPTWSMGAKISIDSATLMNKGLELIEAHFLFDMPSEKIDVVVHPQSVVHSMVEYTDGSTLAQLGCPDMRTPIAVALAWPRRIPVPVPGLDLARHSTLTFEAPDEVAFPALPLAREALRRGGTSPAIMNAANEVAVQSFLEEKLDFLGITACVEATLDGVAAPPLDSLDTLAQVDTQARAYARQYLGRKRAA